MSALESLDVTPDGAAVLDEVHGSLTKYLVFPSEAAAYAVTLYAAATHAAAELEFATRLVIKSPVRRCGKSRLLDVLAGLVHRPLITANMSAASFVRAINPADPPVSMLDEMDTIFGRALKGDEKAEHLRGIINAGFGRNRPYVRYNAARGVNEDFPTFAFAVLAGIGDLPDTIEDRAVIVTLRRKLPGEQVSKYRIRRDEPAVKAVGERLADWIAGCAKKLGDAEPAMPAGLNDRAEDAWESLLAVAEEAGGHWPARAAVAAAALAGDAEEDAAEGMRLLADLRDTFGDADRLWTETILTRLHGIAEAPWGGWFGHPLTSRELARLLRPYGARPQDVKEDGITNKKGYYRAPLADAWTRYAPQRRPVPGIPVAEADGGAFIAGSARSSSSRLSDRKPKLTAGASTGRCVKRWIGWRRWKEARASSLG
ncbi:MAG: DUF3631 domain-containing protein [Streptosporangiaceae bacterium]